MEESVGRHLKKAFLYRKAGLLTDNGTAATAEVSMNWNTRVAAVREQISWHVSIDICAWNGGEQASLCTNEGSRDLSMNVL